MRINTPTARRVPRVESGTILTHEGAPAYIIHNAIDQLRRSVLACMLFEDTFYESGVEIADRIHQEVAAVLSKPGGADLIGNLAFEARTKFKLRHAPLWLVVALARSKDPEARKVVSGAIFSAVQRADELGELLAMYWKDQKDAPISAQMKKGLAAAFGKFSAYDLAKYAGKGAEISARDVMFLVHPKPKDEAQAEIWKQLASNTLPSPDTWEVALSAGGDKKEEFSRLLTERKLGALALLRNLRNMQQAGVDVGLIREGLATMKTERVLPFRFITAARYAPNLEPELEKAMFRCLESQEKLAGKTVLLVDNSGSMYAQISAKSELQRVEAACALAMLLREICDECQVVTFGTTAGLVRPRRGFALRDEVVNSQHGGGTNTDLGLAIAQKEGYDRCIVITDEQSHQSIRNPITGKKGYVINVAAYQNGIGYGPWNHIDGWSESVIDYIQHFERLGMVD